MELILTQDIETLGKVGDIVKVRDGHARNYLIPRQMAVAATKDNKKRAEQKKLKLAALDEQKRKEAQLVAEKIAKVSCTITVEVNDQEKLYGAVSEAEILHVLKQEGYDVERRDLVLEKPIDELGIFEVGVKLHPEVIGKFRLWVTKK
ncbi:MAG: 50S ribosomal protein L9 [Candidatus Omnitrophica bacterium]|nr:50S ribosomal protein L9 [Candidatus Omnitrophota bacterium]